VSRPSVIFIFLFLLPLIYLCSSWSEFIFFTLFFSIRTTSHATRTLFFSSILNQLEFFNSRVVSLTQLSRLLFFNLTLKTSFIPVYYRRSELVWLDGFLFDFLQKKSTDTWLRKFVVNTGYIFSERMVFDQVVRVYLDNVIWPLHYIGALETDNVSEMLSMLIFLYFFFIALLALVFLII